MRTARTSDYWRKVCSRPYESRLNSLDYKNVTGIGQGQVPFGAGITALCGANGVGKTRLLETIYAALDPVTVADIPHRLRRLAGAEITAHVTIEGRDLAVVSRFDTENPTVSDNAVEICVTLVDTAIESVRLISLFTEMKNLDEFLEALSPREAKPEELELLSYIVGRDYESCQTYEIDEYEEMQTFPYFRVTSGGIAYGSEAMGLGEMSLHLLHWHLARIPQGSILLIEEPETYISPRSQAAFSNVLARYSTEKSLWIILTTHSPEVVSQVPIEHVRLLFRQGGQVTVAPNPTELLLQTVLGIRSRYSGVFLVEDKAAREFVLAWLGKLDPGLLQKFRVLDVGGDGEIKNALSKFPKVGDWLKVVGIFDPDMRGLEEEYNWPYTFLPGDGNPETMLRTFCIGRGDAVAAQLGRAVCDVEIILASLEGLNHHDWFEDLSRNLGIGYGQLMGALFTIWFESETNSQMALQALAVLQNTLSAGGE